MKIWVQLAKNSYMQKSKEGCDLCSHNYGKTKMWFFLQLYVSFHTVHFTCMYLHMLVCVYLLEVTLESPWPATYYEHVLNWTRNMKEKIEWLMVEVFL